MQEHLQKITHELLRLDTLRSLGAILLGCLITAIGAVLFVFPYHLVPGGIFGFCVVLHALFPSIQVGTYALLIQVPLLLISTFVLGGKLGIRTLVAVFATPLMINALSVLVYPDNEALQTLAPTLLLDGRINMTKDMIVTTLLGGVLIGTGTGIVIRQQASSGGSDIIAMLLHKFTHIRFAHCMYLVDGSIMLLGFIVIGLGVGLSEGKGGDAHSWLLSFYALITMYVINRTIAVVLTGARDCKLVHIICSPEECEVLRHWILHTLDRTATRSDCRGLYSEKGKEILLLTIRNKELPAVTEGVKLLAPKSFVVVTDAYDAYGYRWKELPDRDALTV